MLQTVRRTAAQKKLLIKREADRRRALVKWNQSARTLRARVSSLAKSVKSLEERYQALSASQETPASLKRRLKLQQTQARIFRKQWTVLSKQLKRLTPARKG